jgi:hypothetical protein
MEQGPMEFAEFYESTRDDCLRIVLLHVGDRHLAHDLVAEAYPMTQALFKSIYQAQNAAGSGTTILIIHPAALPGGAGVQIGAAVGQQAGDGGLQQADGNQTIHLPVHRAAARAHNAAIRVGLVYASQQCTGG